MDGYTYFLLLLALGLSSTDLHLPDPQEYCIRDGFSAECPDGSVVIMEEAVYGRMKFVKCLKYAIGLGCQSDVLWYMDTWCSGQQSCQVDFRPLVIQTNGCSLELNGYLQASYKCLEVLNIGEQCCRLSGEIIQMSLERDPIVSLVSHFACATSACPVIIQAATGQHINMSLYTFNSSSSEVAALQINRNDDTNQLIQCVGFTSIKEEGIGVTFELCASDTRKRHVYTSSTNQLEIVVATEDGVAAFQFFIEFEATGCSDPVPPANGHVQRVSDHAFVRCNESNDTAWEMICRESKWHGRTGNCSRGGPDVFNKDNEVDTKIRYHPIMSIALIIIMTLLISVFIIVTGVLCIKRHRQAQRMPSQYPPFPFADSKNYHSAELLNCYREANTQDHKLSNSEPNINSDSTSNQPEFLSHRLVTFHPTSTRPK